MLLAACATTDDPRQGGGISGLYNLSTGRYEQRVTDREQELKREYETRHQIQAQTDQTSQELAEIRREIDTLNGQLAQMDATLAKIRARIQSERQQTAAQRARLQKLRDAEASARQARTLLESAGRENSGQAARQQVQKAQHTIAGMDNLVTQLAAGESDAK